MDFDDIGAEIGKGILRGIGFLFVEIFFNFIFYYIGWPICKIATLGRYPQKPDYNYLHSHNRQGLLCGFTGMITFLLVAAYVLTDLV